MTIRNACGPEDAPGLIFRNEKFDADDTTTLHTRSPIGTVFRVGLVDDLANDPAGTTHRVIFGRTGSGASSWSLPTSTEADLIAAVRTMDTLSLTLLSNVADASGATIGFAPGDNSSVLAFSSPTTIGSGTSFTSPVPTPAPGAMPVFATGLLSLAGIRAGLQRAPTKHADQAVGSPA